MDIQKNIGEILNTLPAGVRLIAVSKTKPVEDICAAYEVGQRAFGENRPQEMATKQRLLPSDIEWHQIGQLQEKNVKYISSFVSLIHSVDSFKLLLKIDREARKHNRVQDCLLEFHIARETTKAGLVLSEAEAILNTEEYRTLHNIRLVGVMGIATYTDDVEQIRKEFQTLHDSFKILKSKYFSSRDDFKEISMGMSDDYLTAIEAGSTMVRIGSSIFGERGKS